MRHRTGKPPIGIWLLFLPGLFACSLLGGLSGAAPSPDRFAEKFCSPMERPTGMETDWPSSLPAHIPPLDGEIASVLGGGRITRIFYRNVTAAMINAYVDQLAEAGFVITAIVYEREGFPATNKEIDAIDAVKDGWKIRIEYGCGQADLLVEQQ